jgi:hypothetical protein
MSTETESIVLGVIALFAAVGTAVAIRRKTAQAAVACCIVGAGVLLLYCNLDGEARREAERQEQRLERQERWRVSNRHDAADDPQSIVSPNGQVHHPNALDFNTQGDRRSFSGSGIESGMRPVPGTGRGEGINPRAPQRRRLPTAVEPGRSPPSDEVPTPQSDRP